MRNSAAWDSRAAESRPQGGITSYAFSHSPPPDALLINADAQGRLWIVIGTDSGFEGRTEIYYLDGVATFTPA